MKRLIVIFLVVIATLSLQGCVFANSLMYAATALEAWVKDADTGQPLDGVIVVAQWELKGGLHPDAVGSLMVLETVTDATGRFSFPAWGPRLAPLGTYIWSADPKLLLFKPDYQPERLYNKDRAIDRSPLRHSDWHGKTIKLKKFTGSLEEYAKRAGDLDDTLEYAFFRPEGDCEWKQIPRMLVALHLENKRFSEQRLRASSDYPSSIEDRDYSFRISLAKCGSIKEFLRSYLP